ncbi:DNA adenine methylase [Roseiconus lacunae]|uniref:DNA adenine methylase n=1 Tax=Roseiconus lacunae TaxID=2605694 RepID=A0ABT7PEF9_9BACT|nr:DNA adenine methylase [Roseiconus lacunae]MDM4014674.1 DNA adenine methylase [Roseiconus lacunae]
MIAKVKPRYAAPIKWHGGKHYLADRIIGLMPDHVHYVEPFFGGGAVLFRKPAAMVEQHSEVINDAYVELTNFWSVLRSQELFESFRDQVSLVPFSKPEWELACNCESCDPVEQAVAFFIRYRQSRQGLGRDFATMSRSRTRRGMNEQVSSWLSAIDGLEEAHKRLQRVVIYCEDAVSIIEKEDSPHSFFYCDPPYLSSTRVVSNAYNCEMDDASHGSLLDMLGQVEGKFALSGYRSKLYDSAAARFGWNRTDIEIDNKASGKKSKPKKIESVWTNY